MLNIKFKAYLVYFIATHGKCINGIRRQRIQIMTSRQIETTKKEIKSFVAIFKLTFK